MNSWNLTEDQIGKLKDNRVFIIDGELFYEGPSNGLLESLGIPFELYEGFNCYAVRDGVIFWLRELYTAGKIPEDLREFLPDNSE